MNMTVDAQTVLYNLGGVATTIAFFMYSARWLRACMLVGSTVLIIHGTIYGLTTMVFWNSTIFAINTWYLFYYYFNEHPAFLRPDQKKLYKEVFSDLTVREFLKIYRLAKLEKVDKGTFLIHKGDKQRKLYLMLKGNVICKDGDRFIAELGPGFFLGEMSFITGKRMSADVIAEEPVQYLAWDPPSVYWLKKLRRKQQDLHVKFYAVLAKDLIKKLQLESSAIEPFP